MLKAFAIGLMATSASLLMVDDASAFGRHRHRGHHGSVCHQPAVVYAARPAVYAAGPAVAYGYSQPLYRSPVSAYRYPYGGVGYGGLGYGGLGCGRAGSYGGYGGFGGYGGRGFVSPYSSF